MTNGTTQPTTHDRAAGEQPLPSGRKWPVIIIGLLLLNVGVCATTVTLSLRNPATVEADYYDKAMNWDAHRGLPAAETTEED